MATTRQRKCTDIQSFNEIIVGIPYAFHNPCQSQNETISNISHEWIKKKYETLNKSNCQTAIKQARKTPIATIYTWSRCGIKACKVFNWEYSSNWSHNPYATFEGTLDNQVHVCSNNLVVPEKSNTHNQLGLQLLFACGILSRHSSILWCSALLQDWAP